jgi:hypothetical protein
MDLITVALHRTSGMEPEEDLAASGRWPADLLQMQDVGGTVSGLHDRPHRLPS